MKKITLLISTVFLFTACGGSNSGSNSTFEGAMVVSQSYTVFPGDKVIKASDDAAISVTHKEGEAESSITLLQGEVSIVRQP